MVLTTDEENVLKEIIAEKELADIADAEQAVKDDFFTARNAAVKAWQEEKAVEKQSLIDLWQAAEDNNYKIPK